ncbi:hypothetical protein BGY98DRAFT_940027 [Russula aff. rugulosa BPL654]|nr:hypothetical protein BGY98DRAFT_940027 [Russula aff. rugulosa BPL654]
MDRSRSQLFEKVPKNQIGPDLKALPLLTWKIFQQSHRCYPLIFREQSSGFRNPCGSWVRVQTQVPKYPAGTPAPNELGQCGLGGAAIGIEELALLFAVCIRVIEVNLVCTHTHRREVGKAQKLWWHWVALECGFPERDIKAHLDMAMQVLGDVSKKYVRLYICWPIHTSWNN